MLFLSLLSQLATVAGDPLAINQDSCPSLSTRIVISAVSGRQEAQQRQTVQVIPQSHFSVVGPLRTKPSVLRPEHKAGAGGLGTRTLFARTLQSFGSLPNFPKGYVRTTQRTIVSRGQRKVGSFSLFNNNYDTV